MKKEMFNNNRGAIALLTVVIVTAVLLATGIVVISNSIDISKISLSQSDQEMAKINANTCLEESLYKLKSDSSYTIASPGVTIALTNGSCNFTVANGGGTIRNVTLKGVYSDSNFQQLKVVNVSTSPFTISN